MSNAPTGSAVYWVKAAIEVDDEDDAYPGDVVMHLPEVLLEEECAGLCVEVIFSLRVPEGDDPIRAALWVITAAISEAGCEGAIEDLACVPLADALAPAKAGPPCSTCGPTHPLRTCANCDDCVDFAADAMAWGA